MKSRILLARPEKN